MSIKVAFGSTVLDRSIRSGKHDGIAVYCENVLSRLKPKCDCLTFNFLGAQLEGGALGFPRFKESLILSTFTNSVENALIGEGCDLIHVPDHLIPFTRRKIPLISTIHDVIPLEHPEWVNSDAFRIKLKFFEYLLNRSSRILTVSNYSKKRISEVTGYPQNNIDVVYPGVTVSDNVSEQSAEKILNKYSLGVRNYFFVIGTLQPRKNTERVIQAFLESKSQFNKNFKLVIVGRNGWGVERLVKYLSSNQARDQSVIWLDYVSDIEKTVLLKYSRALLFVSLSEGFGLPILEAYKLGVPVLTSNVTSMPEVAGRGSLIIDPYSIEEICTAMRRLFYDKNTCQELVNLANLRVDDFSWDSTIDGILESYRVALSL